MMDNFRLKYLSGGVEWSKLVSTEIGNYLLDIILNRTLKGPYYYEIPGTTVQGRWER